jgi:hypothetical protein
VGRLASWGKFVPLWFRIGSGSWSFHRNTKAISVRLCTVSSTKRCFGSCWMSNAIPWSWSK